MLLLDLTRISPNKSVSSQHSADQHPAELQSPPSVCFCYCWVTFLTTGQEGYSYIWLASGQPYGGDVLVLGPIRQEERHCHEENTLMTPAVKHTKHVCWARAIVHCLLAEVFLFNKVVATSSRASDQKVPPGHQEHNSEHFLPSIHKLNNHRESQTKCIYPHCTDIIIRCIISGGELFWTKQSECASFGQWRQNVESTVNGVFSLLLSLCLEYLSSRRGCPRVLKFCMRPSVTKRLRFDP